MFQLKHNAIDQAEIVAANILGRPKRYSGAYAFARVHFWDTHAATFGKTTLATNCELGELEIIEKQQASDYLRLILKDDIIVGGQAIGGFARHLGSLMASMRRGDRFSRLQKRRLIDSASHFTMWWPDLIMRELVGCHATN